ncbi:MAG: hypothetical protein Q4B68_00065 [Bacteroidales bacterium]|nr:hypothetical protein [Bacteroidales bacterium]
MRNRASTILAIALLALTLSACRTKHVTTTETTARPVVMHDTLWRHTFTHDTTLVHDSVRVWQKGDTIFKEKYLTKCQVKIAHDTTLKIVERPVEIVKTTTKTEIKEVNRLYWWQQALIWTGILTLCTTIATLYKMKILKK